MAKQTIFGRISTLVRANINQLIDDAEDPQKMLDQLVRDYTNNIADAKTAIAQTIGNVRLLEQDHEEDKKAAVEWGQKAANASAAADKYRSEGKSAEADKFDNLAKIAIGKQIAAEQEVKDAEPNLASQNEAVEKLKTGLAGMEQKLEQLRAKRDNLVARSKTAEAQSKRQRRARQHRRARPDERPRSLRGEGPSRRSEGARAAGAAVVEPRRPVREPRGRRQGRRGRGTTRRAEVRRLVEHLTIPDDAGPHLTD